MFSHELMYSPKMWQLFCKNTMKCFSRHSSKDVSVAQDFQTFLVGKIIGKFKPRYCQNLHMNLNLRSNVRAIYWSHGMKMKQILYYMQWIVYMHPRVKILNTVKCKLSKFKRGILKTTLFDFLLSCMISSYSNSI